MPPALSTDIDSTDKQRFSPNELVETYLHQSSATRWFCLGDRRPQETEGRAHDLWDYLGDFA